MKADHLWLLQAVMELSLALVVRATFYMLVYYRPFLGRCFFMPVFRRMRRRGSSLPCSFHQGLHPALDEVGHVP